MHNNVCTFMSILSFDSPLNFLSSFKSNRFAIAATFGATASVCLDLFSVSKVNEFFPNDTTHWWKGINAYFWYYSIYHIYIHTYIHTYIYIYIDIYTYIYIYIYI